MPGGGGQFFFFFEMRTMRIARNRSGLSLIRFLFSFFILSSKKADYLAVPNACTSSCVTVTTAGTSPLRDEEGRRPALLMLIGHPSPFLSGPADLSSSR